MRDLGSRRGPDPLRPGRDFHVDLQLRYLSPGAFTVLPPDGMPPPDPPEAPAPYRLTPSTRRTRNQAFSIIAEPNSRVNSRSPSPTGRVSPFRGRGFNPTGSRHTSPAPSPPLENTPIPSKSLRSPTKKSKIPQMQRRNNSVLFGEKVLPSENLSDSLSNNDLLRSNLSKSMNNISSGKVSTKPPPSPHKGYSKNPAFRQLSPIVGSSPEPSQSQSSPSPQISSKSRSQPQSRLPSPSRLIVAARNSISKPPSRVSSREPSRPTSRVQSRTNSREPSPSSKTPQLKTNSKYKNVQSKINSFSKPKVPQKPIVTSDSELSDRPSDKTFRYKKQAVNKVKRSVNKIGATSKLSKEQPSTSDLDISTNNTTIRKTNINVKSKKSNNTNTNSTSETDKTDVEVNINKKTLIETKSKTLKNTSTLRKRANKDENSNLSDITSGFTTASQAHAEKLRIGDDSLISSAVETIASETVASITKPLKVESKVEFQNRDLPRGISPMVDGRVLSATSVSHAINKMNDTVLDTKTLMRESGLSKLSPAASAIISMSRENKSNSRTMNGQSIVEQEENKSSEKNETPAKFSAIANEKTNSNINNRTENLENQTKIQDVDLSSNHITSTGLMDIETMERNVQNNMRKLITADKSFEKINQKTSGNKVHDNRAVFSPDVQPIQILVKEKPHDQDVESGNIRLPVNATNGSIHRRPSLPPDTPVNKIVDGQKEENEPVEQTKGSSRAAKFLTSAKNKLLCRTCIRSGNENKSDSNKTKESEDSVKGCFSCLKKKDKELKQSIRINVEGDPQDLKPSCWERIKCWGTKQDIPKQSQLPFSRRQSAWEERRDSILSDIPQRPSYAMRCRNFLKNLFCLHLCQKKRKLADLQVSRRASTLSKKKSLTPTSQPLEDQTPKLDLTLVEHTSHMKAAIPVLPISLAWFCLVMNCILPGTGTALSGLLCLCLGKPRFSQKDSIRSRIGAFIIDCIVGFSQFFTILFCLVGWGWSVWWGVIMVKLARKYKKLKLLDEVEEKVGKRPSVVNHSTRFKDPERGS